jgi:hypothetical protein
MGAEGRELVIPPFIPRIGECQGLQSSSMSSMLFTGDRGFARGGSACPDAAEAEEPLDRCLGVALVASNSAKTSLRSSSSMASKDMCGLAIGAATANPLRPGRSSFVGFWDIAALAMARPDFLLGRMKREARGAKALTGPGVIGQ